MLLNLLYPTKGRAFVFGGSTSDPKISEKIGYLPEDSYLYKYLSARETLDFYGRIFSIPSSVRKARIDALLEMVGLSGMANRPVGTYSKGMARRIGLAQALINDPDLLILDEPTSGMDPIGTRQMKDLFLKLAKRGKTILLCSHLLADVEDICDQIGILYGGKMQVEGQVESLLKHANKTKILTGALSELAIDKIKQIIAAEHNKCEVVSPMDKLEEFFIQTVNDAQQQQQPTSGAVSTNALGGFLVEPEKTENILDNLVSTPIAKQTQPRITQTEHVKKAPPQPAQDNNLLADLTQSNIEKSQADTESTEVTEIKESAVVENVKEDVLDKLTAGGKPSDGSTETTSTQRPGDSEDA